MTAAGMVMISAPAPTLTHGAPRTYATTDLEFQSRQDRLGFCFFFSLKKKNTLETSVNKPVAKYRQS